MKVLNMFPTFETFGDITVETLNDKKIFMKDRVIGVSNKGILYVFNDKYTRRLQRISKVEEVVCSAEKLLLELINIRLGGRKR